MSAELQIGIGQQEGQLVESQLAESQEVRSPQEKDFNVSDIVSNGYPQMAPKLKDARPDYMENSQSNQLVNQRENLIRKIDTLENRYKSEFQNNQRYCFEFQNSYYYVKRCYFENY